MNNYYFNNEDPLRPYTVTHEATEGTVAPDNALRIPPKEKKGYWPCERNGKWVYIEDHRGTIVYNTKNKEEVIIDYLGPIKNGFTIEKPEKYSYWSDNKWVVNIDEKNNEIIKNNKSLIESRINLAEKEIKRIELLIKYNKALDKHLDRARILEIYISDLYLLNSDDPDIIIPELP